MKYFFRVDKLPLLICYFVTCILINCASAQAENKGARDHEVILLASSSLTLPMTELIRSYTRSHGITISASFDGTAEQIHKITMGDPADLIISAHPFWINELKQQGLIDVYSITQLLSNHLVLAAAKDFHINLPKTASTTPEKILQSLNKRTNLVIGHPESTALGRYTRTLLESMDPPLWPVVDTTSVKTFSAQAAQYLVANGAAPGILFYSDVFNHDGLVLLADFKTDKYPALNIQAAVVAGEHMEEARAFLDFLKTPHAKHVFQRYGFDAE
jgi:molybdate transport system substrate-binding protein